jgi:hypothetical protein
VRNDAALILGRGDGSETGQLAPLTVNGREQ